MSLVKLGQIQGIGNHVIDPHTTIIEGIYAYVSIENSGSVGGEKGGLLVLNISNPASPSVTGWLEGTTDNGMEQPRGIWKDGNYVYVCGKGYPAAGWAAVSKISVANPSNPSYISKETWTATGGRAVVVCGDETYIYVLDRYKTGTTGKLYVINKATMNHAGSLEHAAFLDARAIKRRGNYLYTLSYYGTTGGLSVIDISTPTSPSVVTQLLPGGTIQGMYVDGDYAYLAGESIWGVPKDFAIIDISTPSSPSKISAAAFGADGTDVVVANNNYAYESFSYQDKIVKIDVRNKLSPALLDTIEGAGNYLDDVRGLALDRDKIYACSWVSDAVVVIQDTDAALGIPQNPNVTAGIRKNIISWTDSTGEVDSYNIYWSSSPGVTKETGTKIADVTSAYEHYPLTSPVPYYYVVTAENSYWESDESTEINKTPIVPPPVIWKRAGNLAGVDSTSELAVSVSCFTRASNGIIFAGTTPYSDVFKSIDNGLTWTNTANITINDSTSEDVYCLAIGQDSTAVGSPEMILVCINTQVFKSINYGTSWAEIYDSTSNVYCILQTPDNSILIGVENQIYKSVDYGESWAITGFSYDCNKINDLYQTDDDTVYVVTSRTNGYIFKSTNDGDSWNNVGSLIGVTDVNCILEAIVDSTNSLFIGTSDSTSGEVYKFESNTWINTGTLEGAITVDRLIQAENGWIYAVTNPNGIVFRTWDGATWIKCNTNIGYEGVIETNAIIQVTD